ncbi:MAG TPA: GNAT family N-acetyltransferase [Chitinophagales bacterium]|jgi:ElaA protein|nr:GNAT family N-acetyltransferase [Chitinophagales bacterium]HQV77348.1 GNAT family N-acetyltransferase [Chitinophagales bacterium]HQW78410.1 GNAT family N-acetyltransferase [Chitinophagales bacterium]HRB18808.1 GNAT family N-acetyltransferase [Chitinophagales bacterium]HRB66852.1 GNAT family N-acetyltransferase [Chitinophagales bacterium]
MKFILHHFQDLSVHQLYAILQLREEVFQIEQNCIYKDVDDKDKFCWHLMLYSQDELVAYCRLVPQKISYENYVSIGRVVSKTHYRKLGYGRQLMEEAMRQMEILFPTKSIKISAQYYLVRFYESYGFKVVGEQYIEDLLPHIAMIKNGN